jgi:putative heme iron utilization protein
MQQTAPDPTPSRLDLALLSLLHGRRTATLGTLTNQREVSLSMVPYAIDATSGSLVILVSGLAAHTHQLQAHPRASVLVTDSVHALARVSLDVTATWPAAGSSEARRASQAHQRRHPAADMLIALPDFRWACLHPQQARQVAGFGAARTLGQERLLELLRIDQDQRR